MVRPKYNSNSFTLNPRGPFRQVTVNSDSRDVVTGTPSYTLKTPTFSSVLGPWVPHDLPVPHPFFAHSTFPEPSCRVSARVPGMFYSKHPCTTLVSSASPESRDLEKVDVLPRLRRPLTGPPSLGREPWDGVLRPL